MSVTDPKGSIVVECGNALLKNGYKLKIFNTINFSKSMHYNPMSLHPQRKGHSEARDRTDDQHQRGGSGR